MIIMEWKVVNVLRRVLTEDDGYLVADESFSPTAHQIAALILGLITALIIVTVIFEFVKDVAIESADKYMRWKYLVNILYFLILIFRRPIVLTLFAEMTVLGFISLCSFVIAYGGTLDDWSTSIFGNEGYIESVLEEVHYFLFLVMIMTIIQVFILVAIGNSCNEKFEEYNKICQDREEMKEYLEKIDDLPHVTTASWIYDYLTGPLTAWEKHTDRCKVEEVCIFYALRREHLLHRDPLPPFLPAPKENQLPANFDYAHYLSLCLSRFLNKLVLFTPLSWLGLWIFALIVFGVMMAADGVWIAVAGVILVLGYVDVCCIFALEDKCNYIYEHLVNPSHLLHDLDEEKSESEARRSGTSSQGKGESKDPESLDEEKDVVDVESKERNLHEGHSSVLKRAKGRALAEEQGVRADLPKISEIPKKERKQSVMSRLVVGKIPPNRHEALFFFDKLGPGLNVYFLRLHLLLQSIYYSVMVCFFIPYTFSEYGVIVGVCFLIIALLPIPIQYMGFYGRLIVQMSHVQSTGMLKDLEVEKVVVRTQKMDRLIKLMIMFEKIEAAKEVQREESGNKKERKLNQKMSDQVELIGSVFDKFVSRNKKLDGMKSFTSICCGSVRI